MDDRGAGCQGGVHAVDRWQRLPDDRQRLVRDGGHGLLCPDQRQHRLAAVADFALGQHGLVLQVGVDAEAVAAGNVRCREDADRQGPRSPSVKRARWCGERTSRRTRQSAGQLSAPYASVPSTLRRPSRRTIRAPMAPSSPDQLRPGRRIDNGVDDLEVARAAAEDAGQRILHLGPIRPGRAGEQVGGRHQHARRADPALGSTMGQERVAQPLVARVGRQAFNRDHAPPGALPDRDEAGADLLTIQQDGAGSAIAGIAADLGAGEGRVPRAAGRRGGGTEERPSLPAGRSRSAPACRPRAREAGSPWDQAARRRSPARSAKPRRSRVRHTSRR